MRLVRIGDPGAERPGASDILHGGETMTLGVTRLGTQTQHVITLPMAAS